MENLDTRQAYCFANAAYFTAIRGRDPRSRSRLEFASFDEAQKYARQFSDGRTMIYAVTAKGCSDHIANA